jgi:hypothetical protein
VEPVSSSQMCKCIMKWSKSEILPRHRERGPKLKQHVSTTGGRVLDYRTAHAAARVYRALTTKSRKRRGPTPVPRTREFLGPPRCQAPSQVRSLQYNGRSVSPTCRHMDNHGTPWRHKGYRLTCVEPIASRHPGVLLKRRQCAQIDGPFAELRRLRLKHEQPVSIARDMLAHRALTSSVYRMIPS